MADPRITLSAVDRTGAAFTSAKRNLEGLLATSTAIGARLGPILGTVGLLGGALSSISFAGIVRGVDALNDAKDATGASIENLSALEDVAARTGTDFGTVTTSLVKLNGVLKDADPDSPAAQSLRSIGLSVKDLREQDPAEALRQVALALSGYADDGKKAQLAQELFGRSIREVAPLLNDLAREGQLNATVTTEQAEAAERFNRQLADLEKTALDVARAVAGPVVEGFNAFFNAVDGGDEDFRKLSEAAQFVLVPLQALTVLGANVAFVLKGIGTEIGGIAAQAAALARLDFKAAGQIRAELILDREQARKELDEFERRVLGLQQQAPAADGLRALRNLDNGQLPRPSAPVAPPRNSGRRPREVDQVALLRSELQRREQIIQSSLSEEQDIIRFTDRFVQEVYRSGTTSLESTFQAQAELRRRNVEEIRRASEETIRAEEAFQSGVRSQKAKDPREAQRQAEELAASEQRIAQARGRVAAAEQDAQQQADLAAVQKGDQTRRLREEVDAFNAALQDLADGGSSRAGELEDIAARVRAAQDLLIQSGVPEADAKARAERLRTLLEQQRQFNLVRDELARITDRARDAEEALLLTQERAGTGLEEGQRQVFELRKQELAQLDALIAKTRELAAGAAQRNGGVVPDNIADDLRRLELQRQRLAQILDPQRLRAEQSAGNIGDAIANGLERAIVEGEKLSDIIKSLDREIVAIVTREVITEPLAKFITNTIKGSFTDGGGNILQQLFASGGGAAAGAANAASQAATQAAANAPLIAAITTASATETTAITTALTAASATTVSSTVASEAASAASVVAAIGASTAAIVAAITARQALDSLSGVGSLAGGGFAGLGGTGFGGDLLGFIFHAGGVAGQPAPARAMSLDVFRDAVRYHSGGVAGMAADAAPPGTIAAVLQVGEEAIAPSDPRHRANPLGRALAAGESIARGDIFIPGAASIVRKFGSTPGLAADEVPAFLPLGTEILTADDPRHTNNIERGTTHVDRLVGLPALQAWDGAPRFHDGGVAGSPAMSRVAAVMRGAEAVGGGQAGSSRQVQQALHYHAGPGESKETSAQRMRRFAREAGIESRRGTAG